MRSIDLNCDLGEGFPDDARLINLVSSVNVACGGHAGDDDSMRQVVRLARAAGVNVGGHPGYDDRANFGRVAVDLPAAAVGELILRQTRRLAEIAAAEGARLSHVKPHGALYHAANANAATADALVTAVASIDRGLRVVAPAAGELAAASARAGLAFVAEGFVDRRYQADGTLVPRGRPDAVIHDAAAAVEQAIGLIVDGKVKTADGGIIALRADTLCIHGDGAAAAEFLTVLRRRLAADGIEVRAF